MLKRALEKAMLVLPLTDTDVLVTRLNLGPMRAFMSLYCRRVCMTVTS